MPRTFFCMLAYDGSRYGGWQIQPNSISIQQKLEDALRAIEGVRVKTVASGRTDAGVHAMGQVASFSLEQWRAPADRLVPAINRRLPEDIIVRSCKDTIPGFHALRDAVRKRYRYTILASPVSDPLRRHLQWHLPIPLQPHRMQEACRFLIGEKDFASFQKLGSPRRSTVRIVHDLTLQVLPAPDGKRLDIEIEANGFLYNMVRNIVGALVAIGTGRFQPEWMEQALHRRDRGAPAMTAPAHGLCLLQVDYPPEVFLADPLAPVP